MSPGPSHVGDSARRPELDPGVARSAGLGSIGASIAGPDTADSPVADTGRSAPRAAGARTGGSSRISARLVVGAAAAAVVVIAVIVVGLSLFPGSGHGGGGTSASATSHGRLSGASLATARARYAASIVTYEQDLRTITTTSALALTGNGSYSSAVAAWNQFSSDTQGLSSAALSIPATSATVHDVEALISANTNLQASISEFMQNPTSQASVSTLKSTLMTSAAGAAQVQGDLGLAPGGLQATGGASLASTSSP